MAALSDRREPKGLTSHSPSLTFKPSNLPTFKRFAFTHLRALVHRNFTPILYFQRLAASFCQMAGVWGLQHPPRGLNMMYLQPSSFETRSGLSVALWRSFFLATSH